MIELPFQCRANGKLLITGEYFVLDGALALAVPTIPGQQFSVTAGNEVGAKLRWRSLDRGGREWFAAALDTANGRFRAVSTTDETISGRLEKLLNAAATLEPLLPEIPSAEITTMLEFPLDWGLGSSSTLIHCFSNWLGIDPYALLGLTFGGSGYDVACAGAEGPLFYQNGLAEGLALDWTFKDRLHFVHLGRKQDSREAINYYRGLDVAAKDRCVARISGISRQIAKSGGLEEFRGLIEEHEALVAEALDLKRLHFPGLDGTVKSLGAWGGDFSLAASPLSTQEVRSFFEAMGYHTVIPWRDLVME